MPTSKRRWGREMALQMLYQAELGESSAAEVRSAFDPFEAFAARDDGGEVDADRLRDGWQFACELFEGTAHRLEEIDGRIAGQAENWRLERMPAVDRNILRLAVYELIASDDVPPLVVLDEAIELAKQYGSEQSSSFINGLLDGLLKKLAGDPGSGGDAADATTRRTQ